MVELITLPPEILELVLKQMVPSDKVAMLATAAWLHPPIRAITREQGQVMLLPINGVDARRDSRIIETALKKSARVGDALLVKWLVQRSAELALYVKVGPACQLAWSHGHRHIASWLRGRRMAHPIILG